MEPYAGRPVPARPRTPTWPMPLAVASLVVFAIVIPVIAFGIAIAAAFTLAGATPKDPTGAGAAFIVGMISGLLAVVGGIAAAVRGTAGVRVVATFAMIVGLLTGGFHTLLVGMYVRSLPPQLSAPEPADPTCGIGSHPTVFGPDDRYSACPDDIATAARFADDTIPKLPTQDVTVASVAEVAQADPTFVGAKLVDGNVSAAWGPAEVTCVYLTWDGTAWSSEILGMYADGGC